MSDNDYRTVNIIEWQDAGTEDVIRSSNAVRDSVLDTTKQINDANAALGNFKDDFSNMPTITMPPPMPLPFDDQDVREAAKQIERVSESTVDFGKASDMLFNALDNVIPGLGGVAEAALSLSPAALLGTAAIAGVTLVMGELQKQAEETRKAVEAAVDAETQRVISLAEITQRTNMALLDGDTGKQARQDIITDLAQSMADATVLAIEKDSIESRKRIAEEDKKRFEQYKLEAGRGDMTHVKNVQEAQDGINLAMAEIEKLGNEATDVALRMKENQTEFTQLNDAAKKLNITTAETGAVMKAITLGADGANQALEKLWTNSEGLMAFGDAASNTFEGIKSFGQDVLKFAEDQEKEKADAAKERLAAEERLIETNQKLAEVEMDRGKVLADRFIEEQRAREMGALEDKLAAAVAYDQQVAKNTKLQDLQKQANDAEIAAGEKFMQDQMKLLANYQKQEAEATADYSLQRVRALEDMFSQLSSLASQRDVAGFVNARASGMTNLNRNDQDFGIEAQRRKANYEQAAQDQISAYQKEATARQTQLQERLQQEHQAGQQAVKQADIVNKQIADLRAQWAAQDLRARRASEDMAYRQTVDVLQRKRMDELRITQGAAAGVVEIVSRMRDSILRVGSSISQGVARGISQSEGAMPMITRPGLTVLSPGRSAPSAADSARMMRSGGSAQMGPVTINMSVGEIATPSQVAAVEQRIVGAITSFAANGNN